MSETVLGQQWKRILFVVVSRQLALLLERGGGGYFPLPLEVRQKKNRNTTTSTFIHTKRTFQVERKKFPESREGLL